MGAYFADYRSDHRFLDQYLRLIQLFATTTALGVKDNEQARMISIFVQLKGNYAKVTRGGYAAPDYSAQYGSP